MKWVLLTGDSGGVGYETVKTLLNIEEYGVIGLDKDFRTELKLLSKELSQRYKHFNFDLSKPELIRKFYLEDIKKIGHIYGLVNNAAFAYDDITTNASISQIDLMFKINVFSAIILTKYIIRDMLLHNIKGSLIHVSSVCAHTGYKGLSMYAATKGAIEAFSRTVAREWGSKGIRSNCIAPGFMETGMSQSLSEIQKERIYNRTSLKKHTEIKSVAETIEFLLSGRSSSITGAVIHVDNGTI